MTFTVGTGSSAQQCSGTTNAAGHVSCSICTFNQSASPLPVTVSYGGNTYYSSSTTSQSVTVTTPDLAVGQRGHRRLRPAAPRSPAR